MCFLLCNDPHLPSENLENASLPPVMPSSPNKKRNPLTFMSLRLQYTRQLVAIRLSSLCVFTYTVTFIGGFLPISWVIYIMHFAGPLVGGCAPTTIKTRVESLVDYPGCISEEEVALMSCSGTCQSHYNVQLQKPYFKVMYMFVCCLRSIIFYMFCHQLTMIYQTIADCSVGRVVKPKLLKLCLTDPSQLF